MLDLLFPRRTYVVTDDQGRVMTDAPCSGCGYNLRQAEASRGCPECGRAATVVRDEQLLKHADADWRRQLARGARVLQIGVWLAPLLIGPPVMVVGLWWLTIGDPGGDENRHVRGRRLTARWLPIVAVALVVIGFFFAAPKIHGDWKLSDGLLSFGLGLGIAGMIYGWRHVHGLAIRGGSAELANAAHRAWRVWIVGTVIGTALAFGALLMDRLRPMITHEIPWYAEAGLVLPAVVVLGWMWWHAVRTLARMRQVFDPDGGVEVVTSGPGLVSQAASS